MSVVVSKAWWQDQEAERPPLSNTQEAKIKNRKQDKAVNPSDVLHPAKLHLLKVL